MIPSPMKKEIYYAMIIVTKIWKDPKIWVHQHLVHKDMLQALRDQFGMCFE